MADAATYTFGTEQEAYQAAKAARNNPPPAPTGGVKAEIASKREAVWQGGKMTAGSSLKTEEAVTQSFTAKRAGFVSVPGMGETTVEAAKLAGLIPQNWQEGDDGPFDEPATGTDKGTKAGTDEGKQSETLSVLEHRAKVAGEILDAVDKAHGSAVTDALIEQAIEAGELPLDALPKGFTEVQMKQVEAGYIAQANAVLAQTGASVPMLQEMMTDEELLRARRATLFNRPEELADLGRQAVSRLAQWPEKDPEGFAQMVADMEPEERKCLAFDNKRQEWTVSVPGKPRMSYGAAVHQGLIRL